MFYSSLLSQSECARDFGKLGIELGPSSMCAVSGKYWSFIGPNWSRDLNTDLWLVQTDHVTLILTCDWSILITWPEYWPVICQERVTPVEGTAAAAWSGWVATPASCWGWSHTGWAANPLSMVSMSGILLTLRYLNRKWRKQCPYPTGRLLILACPPNIKEFVNHSEPLLYLRHFLLTWPGFSTQLLNYHDPGKKLSGVYARVTEALAWIRETVTDGQCYA